MSNKNRTDLQAGFDASGAIETNTSNLVSAADIVLQLDHISDSSFSRLDDDGIRYAAPANVGGTANAITITLTNDYPSSHDAGIPIMFVPEANNTSTPTINVNSIGAINVYTLGQTQVTAADSFDTDFAYMIRFDTDADGAGTDGWVLLAQFTTGGGSGVTITNNGANRILTSDGTSTGIDAESLLTFDPATNGELTIDATTGNDAIIILGENGTAEFYIAHDAGNSKFIIGEGGSVGTSAIISFDRDSNTVIDLNQKTLDNVESIIVTESGTNSGQIFASGSGVEITALASKDLLLGAGGSTAITIDNSTKNCDFGGNELRDFALQSYTVAGVPSASPAGKMIYVSDETGGAVVAFSDGTNWRRVTDRAVVS